MTEKRKWYQVKRVWGGIFVTIGAGLTATPNTYAKIAGAMMSFIGANVFSYGVGASIERDKANK